jgi:translation initiation factor RLI1
LAILRVSGQPGVYRFLSRRGVEAGEDLNTQEFLSESLIIGCAKCVGQCPVCLLKIQILSELVDALKLRRFYFHHEVGESKIQQFLVSAS